MTRPRTGGHERFSDAAKVQVGDGVSQQDFDDAWVFDEFDGVVENPIPTWEEQQRGIKGEQYERLHRLLRPFAKSDDRIFLVVAQTWDDHGKGINEGKQCAFYNPDEHTNPQLQERGRDGLAWPRNLSAEERLDPRALFKNDQKSMRYRNRYTALRRNDGRAADYESQTTKVRELNESRTKEDHRYCEFDDVLSVMMRVWLMRNADQQPCVPGVIPEDRTEEQPPVQQAPPRRSLAERQQELSQRERGYQRRQPPSWGSSSSRGDASINWRRGTGDTSLPFDYLPEMGSYLAVPTNKELKQLFDDLPHRNGWVDSVGTTNQTQGIMTNDKQMRSVVEDHRLADAHNEYFKYNDLFRLRVYQLVTRAEYGQRKAAEARRSNEISKFAQKYLQDDYKGLTYEQMQHLNYHERVELEEKFEEEAIKEGRSKDQLWSRQKSFVENLWKTNQTISPSGIKKLQNDRISQPISMYGGKLPKVEYSSPEARDYMHHTCNTFAVDLSRWYRRADAEVTNHASHQRARYDAQYKAYLQNPEAYPQMEMLETLKLWWREVQKVKMRLEALQRAPK